MIKKQANKITIVEHHDLIRQQLSLLVSEATIDHANEELISKQALLLKSLKATLQSDLNGNYSEVRACKNDNVSNEVRKLVERLVPAPNQIKHEGDRSSLLKSFETIRVRDALRRTMIKIIENDLLPTLPVQVSWEDNSIRNNLPNSMAAISPNP
jgi:hypothetical protein